MYTVNRIIQESDLAEDQKREAFHNMRGATADELDILLHLFDSPESRKLTGEIFRGAHVRICDKGARYDDWKTLPTAHTRDSSHDSDGDQYHVDGRLTHTILFGKLAGWTWLQLESHPIYDLVNLIGHGLDYYRYWRYDKNQGPYGTSPHAEHRDPLIIPATKPYVPIARDAWFRLIRRPRMPGQSTFR
jgi:hypothetical protein